MPGVTLRDLDLERQSQQEVAVEAQQRMVKCDLAKDAKHPVDLTWMQGKGHRPEPLFLKPGGSRTLPIDRAQAIFGPFAMIDEYRTCQDERRREALRYTIQTESDRVLKRYDYERPISKGKDGIEPIGPHRFPDVTVTVLNADGSESESIRLHECTPSASRPAQGPVQPNRNDCVRPC